MRGGQMELNSVDLKDHKLKLFKNRPRCEITLGNEMDLDHFLDTFFDQIVNFFDVVFLWYFDSSGDFAPLPCTVYLVISLDFLDFFNFFIFKNI